MGRTWSSHLEREVADHAPDHLDLLRVLLSEVRDVGPHDGEELQHDRRDAAEVAGAKASFEDRAELGDVDPGLEAGRVHLLRGGREDDVDARLLGELEVARLVSRVAAEINGSRELGRVHEEAHDDGVALGARGGEQREVAGMQRAHRGDEADGAVAARRERGAHLRDRPGDLHRSLQTGSSRPAIFAVSAARTR